MASETGRSVWRWVVVAALLVATPVVAFGLIASAATGDTGLLGWLGIVVAPLALLGTGIVLLTGDGPAWLAVRE